MYPKSGFWYLNMLSWIYAAQISPKKQFDRTQIKKDVEIKNKRHLKWDYH